jgi:hypothetical protein
MPSGASSNSSQKVPTYIPLSDAAQKYGISEEALTQLIEAGKIEAVQLSSGELLVAAENGKYKTKEQIIAEEFSELRGQVISASEASRKYSKVYDISIPQPNFSRWADAGYIEVRERGYRLQLDEADVAYCAKVYAEKYKQYNGRMKGVPIFDEHGNPYQLKYKELAEQKRVERQRKRKA